MENFVFIGLANNEFEFKETSTGQIYRLPSGVGSTESDVHMRQSDFVLLPNGNSGFFDVWNIREHRVIRSNVRQNDPA